MILEPQAATGLLLYSPNDIINTELQLKKMGNTSSGEAHLWIPLETMFYALVENYYDNGYSVRYGETSSQSISKIDEYCCKVGEKYLELLGLQISRPNILYYASGIDNCKGTVTTSNIDTLCGHTDDIIHTDRSNVISDFNSSHSGSNTTTCVLWSAHKIKSVASNGNIQYNRSCSSGHKIFIIRVDNSTNRNRNSQGVLMHELNHQYGAPDHYHELNSAGVCKFASICSQCGTNPRPSTCIMFASTVEIDRDDIICSDCKSDIEAHLNLHHSVS